MTLSEVIYFMLAVYGASELLKKGVIIMRGKCKGVLAYDVIRIIRSTKGGARNERKDNETREQERT